MAARGRTTGTLTLTEALSRAGNDGTRLWVQGDGSMIIMNPGVPHRFPRRRRTGTGDPGPATITPAEAVAAKHAVLPAGRRGRRPATKRGI
jgi:hypothetical protein